MTLRQLAGFAFVSIGLVGYVVGIYVAYPGRALSLTAVMVGVALVGVTRTSSRGDST